MAPHSILAWGIPWTEEPGRLQLIGLKRIRHDLMTKQQYNRFICYIIPPLIEFCSYIKLLKWLAALYIHVGLIISPFYACRRWGSETLNNRSRITHWQQAGTKWNSLLPDSQLNLSPTVQYCILDTHLSAAFSYAFVLKLKIYPQLAEYLKSHFKGHRYRFSCHLRLFWGKNRPCSYNISASAGAKGLCPVHKEAKPTLLQT